jgi:hypothetical protein
MPADVVGGSVASNNSEITALSELTGGGAHTEAELRELVRKIDVTLHNILHGNGTFGGAEYEERGDVGFKIRTAEQVRNMIELRKHYLEMLKDPTMLNDWEILWSQWDDPAL